MAQCAHGGGFSVDASVRIEAAARSAAAHPLAPLRRRAGTNGRSAEISGAAANGRSWRRIQLVDATH
jgi:hypothetical protein